MASSAISTGKTAGKEKVLSGIQVHFSPCFLHVAEYFDIRVRSGEEKLLFERLFALKKDIKLLKKRLKFEVTI